ncbi:MAG: hypothetical protein ACLQMF_03830 [Rectinemataceae bacterium]
MKVHPERRFAVAFTVLALALPLSAWAQSLDFDALPSPTDGVEIESLPKIGLWMINDAGSVAHWLGEKIEGRLIQEPINMIIVDELSQTEDEALARLNAACERSEFEKRPGHSIGYSAYIGDLRYSQIPRGKMSAYADAPFEFSNNHGRLFGPAPWASGFVFTGAFSREHTNLMTKVKHLFGSFTVARDAFARAMEKSGRYEISGFIPLGNAIIGSASFTTGDHDGVAILLRAIPIAEPTGKIKPAAAPAKPVPADTAAERPATPAADPSR